MNLKINFAVCRHFLPCAMARHTAKLPFFAVCLSTWHTAKVALFAVCLTTWHTANCPRGMLGRRGNFILPWARENTRQLPCARKRAHGKHPVCRPSFAVRCLPCVTHGKSFAECFWVFAVCFGTRQTHCSRSECTCNGPVFHQWIK